MSFFDFRDFQVTGNYAATPITYDPAALPNVPTYTLAPMADYGGIVLPPSITAPDSPGWFGGLSDWFSDAGSSVWNTTKSAADSVAGWFSTPSNSNQSVMQQTAGVAQAGTGLFNTVSSWFKRTSEAPRSDKATESTQPRNQGLGVVGAIKALAGVTPPPQGQKGITQAIGEGVGNILSPFRSTLILLIIGLIVFWLVLGRLQRA